MFRSNILIVCAFVLGGLMPYVSPDIYPGLVPADHHNTTEVALQTHTQHNDDVHSMEHYPVEIDPLLPIPTVNISVQDDAMEGYNIYIDTKHFAFIPEKASHTAPIANEGHAHVYVNNNKVGRVYADALHVSDKYFVLGENTVQVTLNAHSHGDWTYDGVVIADIVTVMHEKNGNRELFTSKQSQ